MLTNSNSILKFSSVIFLFILLFTSDINSQVINKFGVKGGLLLSKLTMSEYVSEAFSYEPARNYKLLSMDIGVFAELFDSRFFCVSTELHYNIKGEDAFQDFSVLQISEDYDGEEYRKINDRFHYISLQILPRWKFHVNSEDKLYLFGGPRFDLRVSNSKEGGTEEIILRNGVMETGLTFGIGNEIWDLLTIELRYDINLTNVYTITYRNTVVARKNNSFSMLFGLSLKKLLRIHF